MHCLHNCTVSKYIILVGKIIATDYILVGKLIATDYILVGKILAISW